MGDRPRVPCVALFAGGGGLESGLSRFLAPVASLVPVLVVERESFAVADLAAEVEARGMAPPPVWSDVRSIPKGVLGELRRVAGQRPLVVTAGFPCQPWSTAGKRQRTEDDRWLWDDIARVLGAIRPGIVVLENVPGIALGGLEAVAGTLAEEGYSAAWDLVRASEAGAPHRRERWFCLAYRDSDERSAALLRSVAEADGRRHSGWDGRKDARHDLDPGRVPDTDSLALRDEPGRSGREDGKDSSKPGHLGDERVADPRNGQLPPAERGPGGRARSARTGGGVADADGPGPSEREGVRRSTSGGCGEPPFPPGPAADWSRIPEHLWPALGRDQGAELALRGVADGLALAADIDGFSPAGDPRIGRVDMLRMLGNGVVPQQAELALRMLAELLERWEESQ